MKKIILVALLVLNFPSYATETYNDGKRPESNIEKLEAARQQIADIRQIFNLTPQLIKDSATEFQRLENTGATIEATINKYLLVLKSCESGSLPYLAQAHCNRYDRTDFGSILKREKSKILVLLKQARDKLESLEKDKEGFPILREIEESLEANILVLEQAIRE